LEKKFEVCVIDATLEPKHEIKIIENNYYLGITFNEIIQKIQKIKPDAVGISIPFSINAKSAYTIAKYIKEYDKNIAVIIGGHHPSVRPYEVLENKNIDYIVIGEGEQTIVELCDILEKKEFEKLHFIKGIGFKKNNEIIITEKRNFIENLDNIAFPARHLVQMEEYFNAMKSGLGARNMYTCDNRWVSMITSRGCPFSCNFCSIHLTMGRKFRARSVDNVIAEIKQVIDTYDISHINFEDDNLTLDIKRAEKLFDEILKNNLDFSWSTPNGLRADTLNEELIIKMKLTGCSRVFVAPESGVQHIVDKVIRKKQDLKKIENAVKLFNKHNIIVDGSFVLGTIGETKKDILKTIMYAKKLKKIGMRSAGFHLATPYYGTELYNEAKSKGYIIKEDDEFFSPSEALINTPELPVKNLKKFQLFAEWYVNAGFFSKIYHIISWCFPFVNKYKNYIKTKILWLKSILLKLKKIVDNIYNLIANVFKVIFLKLKNENLPIENIVYEITDACNSRCEHCNIWQKPSSKNMLEPKDIENILKQDIFKHLKVILLTGGEPVLRDNIEEIIAVIHRVRPNVRITLSTNGILFERVLKIARFAIRNNIILDYGVSLDGIGERHDLLRGIKNNFEKVDILLKKLLKLKKIHKDRIGNIVVGHTLSDLTIDSLVDVKDYAEKIGANFTTQLYEEFLYYGFDNATANTEKKIKNYRQEKNPKIIEVLKKLKPSLHNEMLIALASHKFNFKCGALESFFVLKADGRIVPCLCFNNIVIGNIKTEAVEKIWNNENAKLARITISKCSGCSNTWATMWSFYSWPFPFIKILIKLIFKKINS